MSMFVITEGLPTENRAAAPTAPPSSRIAPEARGYESAKAVLEFSAALVLLTLSMPLIALAMILIKLTSRGPAIYTQTRIGKDGRPFTIYKLRSMREDSESLTGAQWSLPGDTRVTRVGRWLRKTHIDELPQLWNVLCGDMSLIGPRPERPEFLPTLELAIPLYHERLRVRPGLSGFAQIQLPPDTDLDSVRIKLAYDLYYVRHMSFLFDVVICVGTLAKLVGLSHRTIGKLCRLTPRVGVENAYVQMTLPTAAREKKC
jgi:lipopolysaccharide/colanic/teichoic acid biosynthesis glycosyltransferase